MLEAFQSILDEKNIIIIGNNNIRKDNLILLGNKKLRRTDDGVEIQDLQ